MGEYLGRGLRKIQDRYEEVGVVLQAGLHIGVKLVQNCMTKEPAGDLTGRIRKIGMENGVIYGLGGMKKNVIKVKPPFLIMKDKADMVLDNFEQSLKRTLESRKQIVFINTIITK